MRRVTSLLLLLLFIGSTTVFSQSTTTAKMAMKDNAMKQAAKEKVVRTMESTVTDQSPMGAQKVGNNTDDQWDVLYTFSAQAPSCQAVATDGDNFYMTYWNGAGVFDKYDMDGNFIESFTISSAAAIRDLAYDGQYFYGAPSGGMSIAQLDLANQTLVSTFPIAADAGVTGSRHLSYDPELDGGNGGFWLGQWGELAAVDMSGNTIYANDVIPSPTSCYGSAYDNYSSPGAPKLWMFTQNEGGSPYDLVMLEEFDINSQTFTGVTLDLFSMSGDIPGYIPGTATESTIAGGADTYVDANNKFVLAANIQQSPNLVVGLELGEAGPPPTVDVGIMGITSPNSGVELTAAEPVTFVIRNYGTDTQSNIPWEITWDGPTGPGSASGTLAGPLANGETAEIDAGTADLSVLGDYDFEACTSLAGDENPANDCKSKTVTNALPEYCDASTTTEDEWIANVLCGSIDNSSGWQGGVADYTDLSTSILPGQAEAITITNGNAWASDIVTCWVDWNMDYEFGVGTDEEFLTTNVGGTGATFEGEIVVPAGTPVGDYRMRVRMTYSTAPVPCGNAAYGEVEDYTIHVGEPLAADVGVTSIDIPAFVEPGVVTPMATVKNFGGETQTFDVTLSDEVLDYSSTMTVTSLASGESVQVMFDDWTATEGVYVFNACTELAGDENPDNDCATKTVTAQFAFDVFAYNAYDPTSTLVEGPVMFDLTNPGFVTQLAATTSDQFIAGGCWAPGEMWYGAQYFDGTTGGGLWEIDAATGDMTFIGGTGDFTGLAHDGSTLYASSITDLYTVDPLTGAETLIGSMGNPGAVMIAIGCNSSGDLYGFDIVDDILYMIDKGTGAATAIGPMGYDFNYAQDMSFDKNTDVCYLSGYTTTGSLYTVDVATGAATLIADFQGGSEITGFAIPYDYPSFDNDLGIAAIVSPVTGYNLTDMEDVTVTIQNYGEVAQSDFDVTYSFVTDNPVTETVAETIEPGATYDYTFTVPADLSAYGDYNFTACTELDGDENPDNDCKDMVVSNLEFGEITGSTKNANTNQALVGVLVEAGAYSTTSTGGPFGAFYTLGDLPAGTYDVVASLDGFFDATYPGVEVLPGESTTLNISLIPDLPIPLPFMEMWDDTSFATNIWQLVPEETNWRLDAGFGNPAPSAEFYWSPGTEMYDFSLESRTLYGIPVKETEVVLFEYDLYLDNYSLATVESMAAEVWDGTDWVTVYVHDNQGDDFPWTTFSHDITDLVTGVDIFKVRFRAFGDDTFNINWWNLDNIKVYQTTFVNFSGTITELSSGNPIEGANIMLDNTRIDVQTGPDGTFSVDLEAGTYDVTLTADGYNTVVAEGVEIAEDFVWDVAMTAPTLELTPASFTEEIEQGLSEDFTISVSNNGNGPADWMANIQFLSKSGRNIVIPESTTSANSESHGDRVKPQGEPTDAMFDLQFSYDAETASGLTGLAGAETDGMYLYATKWASNQFVKYELDGTFIEIFTIDGVTGIRDLAFDGQYFYGSNASSTIYEMDFTNYTLVSTIAAAGPCRAIAYDNINDAFWCNNWDSPMLLIARDGSQLNQIDGVPSMYGAAFDHLTAGGPYLWFFAGTTTGGGCWVEQWDVASGTFTGLMHSVSDDLGDFIAGGLFLVEDLVPGTYTLAGLAQGAPSLLFGYELGTTTEPWLTLDITSGTLTGSKETQDITMTLNTADLELGQTYYADIVFSSTPDVGAVTVPVELFVGGDLGFIVGMVTDPMSRAAVGGATITADNGTDMFSTTTEADGSYYLPVLAGTYDVSADKENYMMQMVEAVEVPLDATVTQDFMLEFEPPVLLTAEGGYFDVALEWEGNPLLSAGAKDGGRVTASNVQEFGYKAPPTGVYDKSKFPDMTRQGGDLIEDATVIPELPYNNTGTTDGYTNDYDEVCPFANSTAPDVVYSYTPAQDELLSVDLCGSSYDTKLYIYENELTAGNPYACNDDEYSAGDPCGSYVSALFDLFVTGGNTYYIVVDGYGANSGEYMIDVTAEEYNPCVVECPAGAIAEGEDCPGDEYVDTFNGGCNADVPVFSPVNCGDVICGTASTYVFGGSNYRDTDWYELVITEPQVVSFTVTAEFPVIGGLIEQINPGVPGCENITGFIEPFGSAEPCEELALEMTLIPGTYYFFVAPGVYEGYPCGTSNDYVASWTCSETFISYYNLYRDGEAIAEVYGTTYMDMDVEPGSTYCYTVDQVYEPGMMTGESNELCAEVLYAPEISVNPDMLNESLEPGQTSSQMLTLSNLGLGDLEWTAEVVTAKGRTFEQLGAYPEATVQQDVSDEAEAGTVFPTNGQNQPLAGTRDVLYDNGPLVTGSCATTGDLESMIQSPQTAYGVNFNNGASSSVADEFTVENEWTIESFEFFGYQTNGGVPSTLTGAFVTIWDGDPMNGGQVIWGDQVTDLFVSTEWTGIYRINSTGTCTTARAIHKVVADAGGLVLTPGTYWIEWSVTGTASSGPWCPLVSDVNQTPDGNGLVNNASGVWSQYLSGGVGVEWPFIINGTSGNPWLTIDQFGGTLAPDGSLDINVGFDATDLGPGTYNGTIAFMSNDPLMPMLDVPVELVVYLNEGTLAGYVTDATSRGPVEGVTITADGIRESTVTDEFGYYELVLPIGDYSVTASKAGYLSQTVEPVTIEFNQTTQQDFMLEFAGPVLLYADGGVGEINLGWADEASRGQTERITSSNTYKHVDKTTPVIIYDKSKYPDMTRQGGDLIADATLVDALPYTNTGTTSGYNDDYDEACTLTSTSPDVVYSFTPAADMIIDIDLCGSLYDTKLFVYENELTAGNPYACDDDYYGSGDPCGSWVSAIFGLAVTGGNTYYIVVDGYGGASGDYSILVDEYDECVIECPAGAIVDPEPCPEDEYVDTYNGGCNSDPAVFTSVNCGDVICGTASTYSFEGTNRRDTDWFELVLTEPKVVSFTLTAEFPFVGGLLEQITPGEPGCDNLTGFIAPFFSGNPCDEVSIELELFPGTYYFFVGLSVFEGYPCGAGNNYVASLECTDTFISYYNVFRDGDQIAQTYFDTYTDMDVLPDVTYCYTVDKVIEPGLITPQSNELCASILCTEACDYTFNFYDDWGDSWNGAYISVYQGGSFIGDFTHTSGAFSSLMATLCDGLETSLVWTAGGYDEECGFELLDPMGNIIYSFAIGEFPEPGEFFNFTTACPEMMTQNIVMEQDWNAWSSYVDPQMRIGMEEMMDPIIDQMIITQYFSELYYPEFGIMTMGDYTNQHGYFTKMSEAATLPMTGFMADPTVTVPAGWSLFPVLQECSIAAADVFSNIPGLVIAWDPVGNGIYYPAGNLYTLVDLSPGMAYWIKVDAEASYTYPGCTKASGANNTSLRPVNNTNWNDVNFTPVNHAVIFDANATAGLQEGDMIGAFTSNNWCAGMVEYTGANLGFNLFGDDLTSDMADGFVEGESLTFMLYRPATEEEFEIDVTYDLEAPNADGLFAINGISVISDLKLSPTSIGESMLNGLNIYPNPSTGVFNIAIGSLDEEIEFVVLNAQGQEVYSGSLIESQQLDLSAEPKGVYFIKFINESVLGIEKLVIK